MTKQQDFSMWSVNFILFCLANFLYYGAFYLYIPVLPQYVEMLGGTPADIGLVGGAFGLSSFIIRPYLGKLANEWGRKRMMLLGAISFALLFLLFGRVTGVVPLVVLRLAHGVCLAMYLAASAAYIADYAPVDRRAARCWGFIRPAVWFLWLFFQQQAFGSFSIHKVILFCST